MMSSYCLNKVTDKDLNEVYVAIDALMEVGAWKFLDSLLVNWERSAWRTPLDLLLAYATATLPAKSKLPSRKEFMVTCMRFNCDVKLWKGLD